MIGLTGLAGRGDYENVNSLVRDRHQADSGWAMRGARGTRGAVAAPHEAPCTSAIQHESNGPSPHPLVFRAQCGREHTNFRCCLCTR